MTYYLLKPCRTATAFISSLKRPRRLDLSAAARQLRSAGLRVTDVQVMLIVESSPELTLYESGKTLVKTDDERLARTAIDRVYGIVGLAEPASVAA